MLNEETRWKNLQLNIEGPLQRISQLQSELEKAEGDLARLREESAFMQLDAWGSVPCIATLLDGADQRGGDQVRAYFEALGALAQKVGLSAGGYLRESSQTALRVGLMKGDPHAVDRVAHGVEFFLHCVVPATIHDGEACARFSVLHADEKRRNWVLLVSSEWDKAWVLPEGHPSVSAKIDVAPLAFHSLREALAYIQTNLPADECVPLVVKNPRVIERDWSYGQKFV